MPFRHQARRIFLAPVLALTLAAALAACSSGSSSSSSSATTSTTTPTSSATTAASPGASGSAAAIAQIKANWAKFFNSSTSNSERVDLLQNGSEFASAIKSFAASPLAAAVTSTVNSVTLTSATQASVVYDLTAASITVAKGQTGTAVLQNGTWKVGDGIFCGLLKEGGSVLGITVPAACS